MPNEAIALMAHLMRRAGFGAPYAELGSPRRKGYEATVEELLPRSAARARLRYHAAVQDRVGEQECSGGSAGRVGLPHDQQQTAARGKPPSSGTAFCAPATPSARTPDNKTCSDMFRRLGMEVFSTC